MTGGWEFLEDGAGRWRWRTSDARGLPRESPQTFRSGADCVAHALRHGYLAGTWAAPMTPNRDQPDRSTPQTEKTRV
jgi:hypothetical protein